jgi:hypothetical protein
MFATAAFGCRRSRRTDFLKLLCEFLLLACC